ncbi:META domain-containing protein [Sphingobacterium yanglingense]|uniref:META domain-containing protein n=1 Tax=Sphingobacterium yanglingense TaxID=1437280 RepID=A0A4R6W7P9_9SPHI|nr:META domain-containing protein [Sphingobacterium yanglingense]TDQ73441.1 META domain-containing protein [Sphingobacterium yanglingense]
MNTKLLSLALVASLFFTACNSRTGSNQGEPAVKSDSIETPKDTVQSTLTHEALEGSWTLSAMTTPAAGGKTVAELFKDKAPTLTFNTKENKVEGNNGCNGIGGTYESKEGNSIKIGDKLVGTMMHCEGVAYNEFMQALETVTKFDIQNNELVFISGDIVVLKFTKK